MQHRRMPLPWGLSAHRSRIQGMCIGRATGLKCAAAWPAAVRYAVLGIVPCGADGCVLRREWTPNRGLAGWIRPPSLEPNSLGRHTKEESSHVRFESQPRRIGVAKSETRRPTVKPGESLRDWIKTLVLVLAVVITFRGVVAQAYQIPTGSMERTLLVGDYLYINKMLYGSEIDIGFRGHRYFYHRFPAFRQPQPGDIIVFRYPPNPRQDFIKRCVAVGGQTVELRDKVLFVNGK